ncbi:hypothetical protein ACIBBD_24080 [Streptomyces sp. NPDC051315]|uniref:hypothetical protein n=1 Tax=Streptomyces sp. NPDC051315 TaxID=3365650 RepID=UPI0037B2F0B5
MTHNWLFCRLPGQAWADTEAASAPRLPEGVAAALAAVRDEPDGHWFFHPFRDGTPGTELWVGAGDTAVRNILTRLVEETGRTGGRLLHRCEERAPAPTDGLSTRSSELALAMARSGGLTAADRLALAVLHLRHAAGLLPAGDRSAFLFLCWQHWAAPLDAGQRLALGRRVAERGEELIEASALLTMDAAVAEAWQAYLAELAALTADDTEGEHPGRYLLFEHLRLTHRRLGVPGRTEALAALAVRGAPESALAPGGPVLQSA